MKMSAIADLVVEMYRHHEGRCVPGRFPTLMIQGPPGGGKSALGHEIARRMGDLVPPTAPTPVCWVRDLTCKDPVDIPGMPWKKTMPDGSVVTSFAPVEDDLPFYQEDAVGVLMLDDLPVASPAVEIAVRQLVLFRELNGRRLGDGVVVIVTGNRKGDGAGARALKSHFRSAVLVVEFEVDLDSWNVWAGEQGLPGVLSTFFAWKPSLFSQEPKDADEAGSFACPRQWAFVGHNLDAFRASGALLPAIAGLVGQGPATEFVAFVNIAAELPDPAKVLANPAGVIPNPGAVLDGPGKRYALCSALSEEAAKQCEALGRRAGRGMAGTEPVTKLTEALVHCFRGNKEFYALALTAYSNGFTRRRGAATADIGFAYKLRPDNDALRTFFDFIQQAMG